MELSSPISATLGHEPASYKDYQATSLPQSKTASPSNPFSVSTPLPSHITIQPLTATTLPSFRRTISLLLPIRYPDAFYTSILSDPEVSSLSRAAFWHDRPRPSKRKRSENPTLPAQPALHLDEDLSNEAHLVGAIRCRIEPVPVPALEPATSAGSPQTAHQLYVQALALLSPYRGHGIAAHLLEAVITEALKRYPNLTSVYAHVWEANEEGLDWYERRGFAVEEPVVEGYYRRLKPGGARIVRRGVGVRDWLRVNDGSKVDGGSGN
ncbi:hypothetical protein MMC13_004200 [Lambiella insularis]|nr:hypothetical protein [Lambiella insularis]